MKKSNLKIRGLFFTLLSLLIINTNAQTGLNFQGVARTNNNVLIASQAITIKLSILQGSSTGAAEYTETRTVTTNAQGLFTAVIGDTGAISTLGNFSSINWKLSPKFLKIEMDPAAGTNFTTMGTTQFQYVAYAQYAKSVAAENIIGIVPIALGGTGVTSLAGLKTALALNQINNTTDAEKPISIKTQIALDLIAITVTDTTRFSKRINTKANTVDVTAALDLKLNKSDTSTLSNRIDLKGNAADFTSSLALKFNASDSSKFLKQNYLDSALLTKLSTNGNAISATTASKLATARNINGIAFDGSGDITVTAISDAGTLTGTILKSTVTSSSLTSVGTITNLKTGLITNSGKVVVGASSPFSASAVLEASSNKQGFLPPRMNHYQRTQIVSPVAGLTVWCSNCGARGEMQVFNGGYWTNISGATAADTIVINIGDAYQGGIVAYILFPGDPGYDSTTTHGLIAASADQSAAIQWYNGTNTATGATGNAIGTGLFNTNAIIASQGDTITNYAAALARSYQGGGYTDWYLPSQIELNKLYLNLALIGGFVEMGDMTYSFYWSSTEYSNTRLPIERTSKYAMLQNFSFDTSELEYKYSKNRVRAIRSF